MCVYVSIYVYTHICVCMYVHIYLHVYVSMDASLYVSPCPHPSNPPCQGRSAAIPPAWRSGYARQHGAGWGPRGTDTRRIKGMIYKALLHVSTSVIVMITEVSHGKFFL